MRISAGRRDGSGRLRLPQSQGPSGPFGFTGQRFDQEAGLYYYRARAYSAAHGRFLQADPIGYDAGANLYAYVDNDPLNLIDPNGLSALSSVLQSTVETAVPGGYYAGLAQQEFAAGNYGYAAGYGIASLADATLGILTFGASTRANAALRTTVSAVTKYEVGTYSTLASKSVGDALDIHHVGQKALMSEFVPGYNAATAPAIVVPTVGHTIRGPTGIVSRSSEGLASGRDVIARDVRELRRVYPDIPNSQLQSLIQLNKEMYPSLAR